MMSTQRSSLLLTVISLLAWSRCTFAQVPIRINAGGPRVVDSQNREWEADSANKYYTADSKTYTKAVTIANTNDDDLYTSERYLPAGFPSMGYRIPLSNGNWKVILHWAETYARGSKV
jgi:hypothetical protein